MFRTRYRVVTDYYAGFEVQYRYWWMPFWLQLSINTYPTLERALIRVEREKKKVVWTDE